MRSLRRLFDQLRRAQASKMTDADETSLTLTGPQSYIKQDDDGAVNVIADEPKRADGAWDMDYGWGGGRFGKRRDRLTVAGRFGRSV